MITLLPEFGLNLNTRKVSIGSEDLTARTCKREITRVIIIPISKASISILERLALGVRISLPEPETEISVWIQFSLSHIRLTMYYLRPFLYHIFKISLQLVNVTLRSPLVTVQTVLVPLRNQIR